MILNWQEYIDPTEDGADGTLDRFSEATGITINYSEDFNDNNEVYGREFAPYLGAGDATPGTSSARRTGWRPGSRAWLDRADARSTASPTA